jgi:hypothetical protein
MDSLSSSRIVGASLPRPTLGKLATHKKSSPGVSATKEKSGGSDVKTKLFLNYTIQ